MQDCVCLMTCRIACEHVNNILAAGAIAKFDPHELPNAAFLSPSRNACPLFFVEWVERGINQPAGVQPCSNGLIRVCGARYARSTHPDDPILTRLYPSNLAPAFLEREAWLDITCVVYGS